MRAGTPVKSMIILGHTLVGWMYCGALIGIGRQFMSTQASRHVAAICPHLQCNLRYGAFCMKREKSR
jgi:hypothetical protein